jgi:hypothetical protein
MGVVENMKDVADLVKKFNDIELNRRILNLENEVLDLARAKRRGEEKIEELERTLKFKAALEFKEPFYWLDGDTVPFCPNCWEKSHQPIHVVNLWTEHGQTRHECPSCKTPYTVTNPNSARFREY